MKRTLLFLIFSIFLPSFAYEKPRVSIITSMFKGGRFIEDFMAQIVKQTAFDKSELLIIDANSPENERETIFTFMKNYPNIFYFRLAKDPGIYGVWNYGVHLSRGKYLTNANLDDRYDHSRLEEQSKELDENPDLDAVYCSYYDTNIPNEPFESAKARGKIIEMQEFSLEDYFFTYYWGNCPMWRKTLHKRCGMFNELYKSSADGEFSLRGIFFSNARYKKTEKIYSYFYDNAEGISTREGSPSIPEWVKTMNYYQHLRKDERMKTIPKHNRPKPTFSYLVKIKQSSPDHIKKLLKNIFKHCNMQEEIICLDTNENDTIQKLLFKIMPLLPNLIYVRLPQNADIPSIDEYGLHICRAGLADIIE